MKKIFLASQFILLAAFITSVNASPIIKNSNKKPKTTSHEKNDKDLNWVNYQTEQEFYFDFPEATDINWYQGKFSEATFNDNGLIKTAYYDQDNKLIGTTNDVSYSDLPEKAKTEIEKKFPDFKVDNVIFFQDNPDNDTDMFLYSLPFEDEDSYFAQISNGTKTEIIKIDTDGQVSFFQNL